MSTNSYLLRDDEETVIRLLDCCYSILDDNNIYCIINSYIAWDNNLDTGLLVTKGIVLKSAQLCKQGSSLHEKIHFFVFRGLLGAFFRSFCLAVFSAGLLDVWTERLQRGVYTLTPDRGSLGKTSRHRCERIVPKNGKLWLAHLIIVTVVIFCDHVGRVRHILDQVKYSTPEHSLSGSACHMTRSANHSRHSVVVKIRG